MKTERRHELQTNKLADVLGHQLEQVRPHGKKLLAAGILGAAIIITVMVILKDRNSAQEVARNDFYLALAARDRDALENVAKAHSGTEVALLARQAQADLDLSSGLAALYTNRDEAYRALEDAKKAYGEVVANAGSQPELLRHSLFGLAQAHEATSNLDKSREYYQRVAQQFGDSPTAALAKSRLETLENPQVEKWYNWFGRQKPKPPAQPMMPKIPGLPDDLSKLPDSTDLPLFPGNDGKETPEGSKPAEKTGGAATPDSSKPAESSPASETPSTSATSPATVTPPASDTAPPPSPGAPADTKKTEDSATTPTP